MCPNPDTRARLAGTIAALPWASDVHDRSAHPHRHPPRRDASSLRARALARRAPSGVGRGRLKRQRGRPCADRPAPARRPRGVLPPRGYHRHALRPQFPGRRRPGRAAQHLRARPGAVARHRPGLRCSASRSRGRSSPGRCIARATRPEEAFGRAAVRVVDGLLADGLRGGRLDVVLAEHRRLFTAPVEAGANRVLVGHRTPAIMVIGAAVGGRAFPEGAALLRLEPGHEQPRLLGSGRPRRSRAADSTAARSGAGARHSR